MKAPWGSWVYTTGAWDSSGGSLTIPNISGVESNIEIAAVMSSTQPSTVTATDGGGSFTFMSYIAAPSCRLWIYGRILTNSNSHSVTASGSWNAGSPFYRRMSVYLVANPMRVGFSDLSNMFKIRNFSETGGNGTTVYFPDCTSLKTSGASRLDIGLAVRQYNPASGTQSGFSLPWMSWDTANVGGGGFASSPYYQYTNGNGISYSLVGSSDWMAFEDVGRCNYSLSSNNNWADGGFGEIPYYNKCPNTNGTYPQLSTYFAGFSLVIPNYGGTQMVL